MNLKLAFFIGLFVSSIVYASSEKLPDNSEELVCHQMKMFKKIQNLDFDPPMNTYFKYDDYILQPDDRDIENASYFVKKNNVKLNSITLKNSGTLDYSKALICDDVNEVKYLLLIDKFEGGGEDGVYSGEGALVLEISSNKLMKIIKKDFFDDKYTPQKFLKQEKFLPINYTLFKKDGGLYMKVSSTYKSNVITLKKPTSVK